MLVCLDYHARIDRDGRSNEFTAEQLRSMKREHEARIQLIYSASGVVKSTPLVMSFPVGAQVPVIEVRGIHYAMLTNSNFKLFPTSTSTRATSTSRTTTRTSGETLSVHSRSSMSSECYPRLLPEVVQRI